MADQDFDAVAELRAAGCVFAEEEAALLIGAADSASELPALVARRASGEPLELVLGWAAFCGLRVRVVPGVFVPRRRTELLAQHAVSLVSPGCLAVELCCGAGAVAAVLEAAGARVYATDIDPAASECARSNIKGAVFTGDLYDSLPPAVRGTVRVLVANAPYVPVSEVGLLPAEARDYEPLAALSGGTDGLEVLRRVAAGAPEWLAPGGYLLSESSEGQAPALAAVFATAGLRAQIVHADGATIVIGQLGLP